MMKHWSLIKRSLTDRIVLAFSQHLGTINAGLMFSLLFSNRFTLANKHRRLFSAGS
ncbi:MAG: hypothetical protein MJK12_06820 [Colwellia sp.]|nr:hypothetical protein [Colwellia sp.]